MEYFEAWYEDVAMVQEVGFGSGMGLVCLETLWDHGTVGNEWMRTKAITKCLVQEEVSIL